VSDATPAGGTRKRLDHVDAMRPIKQAAVISTHAIIFLAPATAGLARVNMLVFTHFSREAFLFVSACMLAYSYRSADRVALRRYSIRRWWAVGVPYLTWTAIYFLFLARVQTSSFPWYGLDAPEVFSLHGLERLAHLTWTGYYHLYYLLVVAEFYVIFPWLFAAVKRVPERLHGRLVLLTLAFQVLYSALWPNVYSLAMHLGASWSEQGFWETRLVTSYTFYLVAGVVVALHLDDVHDWIVRHRAAILVGTPLAGLAAVGLNYWNVSGLAHRLLVPGLDPFSIVVIPYNVGAILCVYLLGVFLVSPKRSARTREVVASGSDNAYGIYLSQLIWIPILARVLPVAHPPFAWPLFTLMCVAIVYLCGFVFSSIVARTPVARAVVGRSPATWASLVARRRRVLASGTPDGPLDITPSD
jgi:peptidoglycan/LPS O-acetylase OafA/YrhL